MFKTVSDKIQRAFKHLAGTASITEVNVASVIKDIRKALLDADVQYKIAKEFTDKVKARAIGAEVIKALRPEQVMVKIMQDELTNLLGEKHIELSFTAQPDLVLLVGLQGAGKTTFSGKLAKYIRDHYRRSAMLVAADTRRPAAIEQLQSLGKQINIPVFANPDETDPEKIIQSAISEAKAQKINSILIDTAGRQVVDEELMQELISIKNRFNPTHILFVIDAMMGQEAVNTAKKFHQALNFNGVVLSKLDGDTRGGAAFSIKYVLNTPIVFVSKGEHLEDIELFHPDRLAGRILGMGDVASLVEKAESLFNEEQAKKLEQKIRKNKFDFEDFLSQMRMIRKMGNMKELLGMLPGMGGQLQNMNIDEGRLLKVEAIIQSMTPKERKQPEILNSSRINRIALGSGSSSKEVSDFLHQFEQMRAMMQKMGNKTMPKMPFKMPFKL